LLRIREKVLVTGAAGRVGRLIAPALRDEFHLRRLDLEPQKPSADDELVQADIRDVDSLADACAGVVAIVHLAAQPAEADFRSVLLPRNLDGTWATYEAAVRARVPRFVFASTTQTMEGGSVGTLLSPEETMRPVSIYGCTKLFGEALGRYHADSSGLGVACLRLGAVRSPDDPSVAIDERLRGVWCGSGDVARLIVAAVRSQVGFATVVAVSPPATSRFDTANPFGWTPIETPAKLDRAHTVS
jgi:nucleoside-diphosphate-sugar epimerase